LIITISDTCKNQPKRLDFDNTINLSSLIVSLGLLKESKRELKRIYINWCRYNERLNSKKEGSKHLVYTKKPKDLSEREREDRGCGEGGGLYDVYIRDRRRWSQNFVSEALSLLSYTLRYVSLADLGRLCRLGSGEEKVFIINR
jgi:hypothetical protein